MSKNGLIYDINDKPQLKKLIVYAIQQLLAIMAATLVVPVIIGNGMDPAAALFGAGIGTLVYVAFTAKKSPVFLGSSFAFLGSMGAAFAGGVSMSLGYLGLILGAIFAGLVYVIIALVVKKVGVEWINKLMPAIIIGPTVAVIGLSLAGNAIGDLQSGGLKIDNVSVCSPLIAVLCGVVTFLVTTICANSKKQNIKLIPFIIGIGAGYVLAVLFTIIGNIADVDALKVVSFEPFKKLVEGGVSIETFLRFPDFTFLTAFKGGYEAGTVGSVGAYIAKIAVAYIPVAFVVFAEHIADHKNISSIIGKDLLAEPGLDKTLLGDGVGSMVGAFFGGCPNTTYGESVACVAITRNASVYTIMTAAIGAILIAFLSPFVALVNSIPSCVMGGVCMALYGFIAVSGLKMIQQVDLGDDKNLFVVSVILVAGIGKLSLNFGAVTITNVATALILGIITNLVIQTVTKLQNK